MDKWIVQAEINGRFGIVDRDNSQSKRITYETREKAEEVCKDKNRKEIGKNHE